MDQHPVVLFDGVCNLCNSVVNFVIDHDPEAVFRFAALQSEAARDRLQTLGEPPPPPDPQTFLLLDGGRVYRESTAALRLLGRLRGPLGWMKIFMLVPRPVRDAVYRYVARHRYAWFGRMDACRRPTPELQSRFL